MAIVRVESNETFLELAEPLPFKPHRNFYVAVAQCEAEAGQAVSYINPSIAIVPWTGDKRLVIYA
ncbi:hypothetical protein HGP28_10650 [Vibrio sp. SM6]|uniref:Uncharacterized protein n=1 Tax=Vibrio agarilyticus TaxID=2726741 RepID=A0A7X8TRL4_9VIBR|nr:hypothetical protein [Vibrio agarilyticus]NLS13351.1 hypothetical protein [Vibrio agarilyticus]